MSSTPKPFDPLNYPLENRRDFALWAHAGICFKNCVAACEHLLEKKLTPYDPLHKPLTVCAIIEYAKPFKRSQGLGKMTEVDPICWTENGPC
jgi:hypothetical protein